MATQYPDPKEPSKTERSLETPATIENVEPTKELGTDLISDATNRRLFWMVNRRVLLVMVGTYFFQALDKGAIGLSSIMGLEEDAKLNGDDYSWLGTILYIGILIGEYPTNLLLQKLPIAKYLAANIFCWGTVIACTSAAGSFIPLMVIRFLLGVFESCVQPAFVLLTAMWYTKLEQAQLVSFWYCQMGVQLMIGGLIAYGTSHYHGDTFYSWQLLFLALGVATVAWSFFVGWYLPDSPTDAKCFSDEDKLLLVERIRQNDTGIKNTTYKTHQVKETFRDPVVWCYVALILEVNLVIGGLGVFSNLIIASLGFTTLQTQLLNIAQGAVTIMVMTGSAALATKLKQTCLVMVIWAIPPIIATVVLLCIPPNGSNAGGLLVAFYCTQFILAEGNMILSLVSRNVAGQTKKSTTMTMVFVGWAVGNLIAPQIFRDSDAPLYKNAYITHICLYVVFFALVGLTWYLLRRRNQEYYRRRETDSHAAAHDLAFEDLTDRENPQFEYSY